MRLADQLSLPIAALWQQKGRTVLTTLGVILGSFVLVASISIGQGVQDTIERESHRSDFLRRVHVHAAWGPVKPDPSAPPVAVSGTMTEARRARLREAIEEQTTRRSAYPQKPLTADAIATIAALEHVETVAPIMQQYGRAQLGDKKSQEVRIGSVRPENESCRRRIVAGRFFDDVHERGTVISEYLLYRLGIEDEAAIDSLLGKTLRVEIRPGPPRWRIALRTAPDGSQRSSEEIAALEAMVKEVPQAIQKLKLPPLVAGALRKAFEVKPDSVPDVIAEEYPIVGVLRAPNAEEKNQPFDERRVEFVDILLPSLTALDLFFRTPAHRDYGVDNLVVVADHEKHTKQVLERVKELGWRASAPIDFVERQRLMYLMIFAGMQCVATIALLVAALGIANTMLMSVLERTREIGIMKAVGASNGQLLSIFLIEGALIGLAGGTVGILLAWAASKPGDAWVRSLASRSLNVELKDTLFVFPFWLVATALAFSVAVTTLAAVYPARRAIQIDPVRALRHE